MAPMFPDFVVLGAAKAGTSSLAAWLGRQPGVFIPDVAEPGFFAWDGAGAPRRWTTSIPAIVPVRDDSAYAAIFAKAEEGALRGDVSPIYLESAVAADRLVAASPDLRLVVSLRDPVERAWSDYGMHVRDGLERRPPEVALAAGEHSVRAGEYGQLLAPYLGGFGRPALHVMVFEEWTCDPATGLASLAAFLGLPAPRDVSVPRENLGGRPRLPRLHRALSGGSPLARLGRRLPPSLQAVGRRLRSDLSLPAAPIPPDLARRLAEHYRPDRDAVAALLGRPPRGWLEG